MYFVKTSDDINLAVYDYNPKGKKTVLLIHGWPLSHLMYEYQLEKMCIRDSPYVPGYGLFVFRNQREAPPQGSN